ncbi:MAG: hypothetical protein IPP38_17825 [Bacteroidetes bacterium]|nr:hypothetical protein [Bacteroidota bacterium]
MVLAEEPLYSCRNFVTVNFVTSLSVSATLKVTANNVCGPGQPAQKVIAINHACRSSFDENSNSGPLLAYPNPTKGKLTVNFS